MQYVTVVDVHRVTVLDSVSTRLSYRRQWCLTMSTGTVLASWFLADAPVLGKVANHYTRLSVSNAVNCFSHASRAYHDTVTPAR